MTVVRALYQAMIVDHERSPRNHGPLAGATAHATADNPLCGDVVTVHLRRDVDGRVGALGFEARGCALSRAAASIMTVRARGLTAAEIRALAARFEAFVAAAPSPDDTTAPADTADTAAPAATTAADVAALGDLTAFAGVRAFRSRRGCATLPFRALLDALGPP